VEPIIELILEFLIQVGGEILFELGLRPLVEPFRRAPNPWLAAIGYAVFGAAVGGVSLWLFPRHMVVGAAWRLANLLITPLAVGLCMSMLGAWRAKRGQPLIRIDRFSYGYLFALCFAAVRFVWAR
jgi:hypothetical protein